MYIIHFVKFIFILGHCIVIETFFCHKCTYSWYVRHHKYMYIQDILGFNQRLRPAERKDHLSMAQFVKIYYFLHSAIPFCINETLFCHKCTRIWYVQHLKYMCIQDMSGFDQGLHPVERNDNFSIAPDMKNYYFLQFPISFCISQRFFSHKCTYIWYIRHHK